ncbi:MAG: adenine phosphoribosyltransferase [Elusimicrobia bacterium RIFCSPLOWO2_02_FULL_39_32]|nr:MAG: adenine phosphoribosyltransferase [Elusimicrobia bacterium GWA2_38_7]OGR78495.1 MAG: adenine phosphoribosyltransferase [Elusimicrobia bacterium RIFCSPHIGHO2_02_FULL_39_36]OGR92254.1 MAG: adenine phosphoribosyltransferase [Elusimicrobia bacterium RIFCSPLOWO2_02_FULL_39_32]OGR99879.1 MAG: adenine phosphoribosyltransferase [Elusimicrobia bacterium RIFCSPLOWO2_12_FULL_39_28]
MSETADLKTIIRDVPDFPKKGILFKDITTLLARPDIFKRVIDQIADHFQQKKIEKVMGIESRGFIFGAPIAYKLNAGIVPIRKKGKLPYKTVSATYALEYGTDTLEMHEDAISKGTRVLIVDDLLATGGTAKATAELVEKCGGEIVGFAFLIELEFLKGRQNLNGYDILSLIKY